MNHPKWKTNSTFICDKGGRVSVYIQEKNLTAQQQT